VFSYINIYHLRDLRCAGSCVAAMLALDIDIKRIIHLSKNNKSKYYISPNFSNVAYKYSFKHLHLVSNMIILDTLTTENF